jgi:uncharacterized membrane protein
MRAWSIAMGERRPLLASPMHPIFVHFTIALTASSLMFDLLGHFVTAQSLADAGWWTMTAAVPATLGALISGVTSRRRLPMEEGEARRWLRVHMALGPCFLGGLVAVVAWRCALGLARTPIPPSYLLAASALVMIMTVQGYLGGELVYRFGAEVKGGFPRLPDVRAPAGDPPSRKGASSA